MKKLGILALISALSFSSLTQAFDNFQLGIYGMAEKTDSNDKYELDGVVFVNYGGYELGIGEDSYVDLVPLNLEVSIDGRMVKAYTDVATLSYSGFNKDDIYTAVTLASADFEKFDDYSIKRQEKLAAIDISATKYFTLGSIELDATAAISAGGYVKTETSPRNGKAFDDRETHYGTADFSVGANLPVMEFFDLYGYAGYSKRYGNKSRKETTYVGVRTYGMELADGIPTFIAAEYVRDDLNFEDRFAKSLEDSYLQIKVGIQF